MGTAPVTLKSDEFQAAGVLELGIIRPTVLAVSAQPVRRAAKDA